MHKALFTMAIIVSLVLGICTLTRGHEWGDDFASYIMQAESILSGSTQEFVQHNSFTIFESSNQIGPVAYPWGYPLILTPAFAIKGNNPLALKLPGLFFYAGFLVCLYLLMHKRLAPTESLLITALFAFNPLLIGFLDHIASDIPFLFFSTLSLLLMISDEEQNAVQAIALGFSVACAFFIRTTGILLLASFLAMEFIQIWESQWHPETLKRAVKAVAWVTITFGFLCLLYALLFPGGGESYFAQYRDFQVKTALGHAVGYFQVFGQFFGEQSIWKILYYVLLPLFLVGLWQQRKKDSLFILFFILWLAVLITWPSWQGARFIFPLLPIFVYFVFQGLNFLLEKFVGNHMQAARWTFYGFWILIAAGFLIRSGTNAYTNLQNNRAINGPYDSYSKEVYKYIQDQAPADSVIIFFKPRAMRLMTGHDSIQSTECNRILQGDYLVLSKKVGSNQQIPPEEIGTCNLPLTEVLSNNRFIVYEIQK